MNIVAEKKWTKDFLSSTSTYEIHQIKVNEKGDSKLQKRHEDVMYIFYNGKQKKDKNAIFLAGGAAVGKSSVVRLFLEDFVGSPEYVWVDSDQIKKHLAEYKEIVKQSDDSEIVMLAAIFVHKESTYIADLLIQYCFDNEFSFIYDSTLSNENRVINLLDDLDTYNYTSECIFVDTEAEIAQKRAMKRFEEEKRFVFSDFIDASNINSAIIFWKYKNRFNDVSIYNNDGKTPELIFFIDKNADPSENKVIPNLFDKFLEKTTKKYVKRKH